MTTPIVPSVTDELIAELELDVQVSTEMRMPAVMVDPGHLAALLAERSDLKQQLAAASVDADRYQWLRDKANWVKGDAPQVVIIDWSGSPVSISPRAYPQGETLDAAIDAARDIAGMDIGSGD